MITLYDHINELRAELQVCIMARYERARLQAELAKAVAEQAARDQAADAATAAHLQEWR